MCTKSGFKSLLAGLLAISTSGAWAQTCPTDATDTAVGVALSALRINPDGTTGPSVGPNPIGICECIRLRMSISYLPIGASGGKTAFFEGGTMTVRNLSGSFTDNVTPAGGVPLVGNPTDPNGQACGPGAVNLVLSDISVDYCVNPADMDANGNITFLASYVGGNLRFGAGITNQPTGTTAIQVRVDQGPTCTIAPQSQEVCAGASASFTASATGEAPPFSFTWTGPAGFTGTGPTITINNAQEANEGTYTATVTDAHGCTSTCTAQLIVNPNPTCVIQPASQEVCVGASAIFTVNVSSGTAPFTISWTGPGGFSASGTSITINNAELGDAGTYTANVTDSKGCTTSCSAQLNVVPCCTGTIGDFVWHDLNANGCQDAGEPGIPGVQVDLYSGCAPGTVTLIKSTTTDANGKYLFSELCAGTYTVGFHTPAGYARTLANQTCNVGGQPADATDSDCDCATGGACGVCVTLTASDSQNLTVDCGYVCAGEIGDFVWQDNDGDGCQDAGEPGIPGVQVDLYSGCAPGNVTLIRSTTTDAEGKYLFGELCAGIYTVSFHTPVGYSRSPANQSCNVGGKPSDETDSDCDCTVGDACGICVTLPTATGGNQDLTIDCGYIPVLPNIEVTKEVACYLPGNACGTFGEVATGVKDSACPAFCYRIKVTNVGTVTLTSLTVTDTLLGNISAQFASALPLVPGESATVEFKAVTLCEDTHNVVTAEGQTAQGLSDVDTDDADAAVLILDLVCELTVNPSSLTNSGPVEFSLTLRNTGTAPLRVTSLSGLPTLVDCSTGVAIVPTLPISIGPGGSHNISGCTQVECPAGANFTVTANAEADDQNGTLCVNDQNGMRITASTSCSVAVPCEGCCVFLLIDEDCIDNTTPGYSLPPNTGRKHAFEARGKTFTDLDVNDDRPRLAQRAPLRFFNDPANFGRVIVLRSGQISDEGLFALKEYPNSWNLAGPTTNGLLNFRGQPCAPFPHMVGPGLGTGHDPEILLDKIPRVTPLRATGLSMLVGQLICALVWDSDISINYKPLNGNLQGEKLGVVAFRLLEIKQAFGFSSSTLPLLTIEIVDPCEAFNCAPSLFLDAPEPLDSSEPFDIVPPGGSPVIVAMSIGTNGCHLSCAGEAKREHTVEYSESWNAPSWKVLTNFVGTGSIVPVIDPNYSGRRYYRVVAH